MEARKTGDATMHMTVRPLPPTKNWDYPAPDVHRATENLITH